MSETKKEDKAREPFGEAWEAELMKLNKKHIIWLYKKAAMKLAEKNNHR